MDRWGYLEAHFLTEEEPMDNDYHLWLTKLPTADFLNAIDFGARGSIDVNYLAEVFRQRGARMARFSEAECAIIVEALRNIKDDETLSRHSLLLNTVTNNASIAELSEKWDCSEVSLARKLGGLSEANAADLLSRVAEFWSSIAAYDSIADGLRAVGLLPKY